MAVLSSSVRWGIICRAAALPLLRTHRIIWGPGEGACSGTFPEQSPSPPPALQSQEERRAVSEAAALGNLNPLQREGFGWLPLCAHSEEASHSRDQPSGGPGLTERPDAGNRPLGLNPVDLHALRPDARARNLFPFPFPECKRRVFKSEP